MRQLIGEALAFGLQGLVVLGCILFAKSLYCDLASFCSGKDER